MTQRRLYENCTQTTGKLNIGHLIGSLERRLKLQNDKSIDNLYIMLADSQALTDNYDNP